MLNQIDDRSIKIRLDPNTSKNQKIEILSSIFNYMDNSNIDVDKIFRSLKKVVFLMANSFHG